MKKPLGKPRYRVSSLTGLWVLTDWRWHSPSKGIPMTLKPSKPA